MQPRNLAEVIETIGECLASPTQESLAIVDSLLWDALNQHDQNPHLWHYAGSFANHLGRHAVAAQCLRRCYELESNPLVMTNIGVTLRMQQKPDQARQVLSAALDRLPDDPHTLGAMAAGYVGEGDPEPGIEYGERALKLTGDNSRGEIQFNLALLHLEAGHFARGFDLYATGKHRWREQRMYANASTGQEEPPELNPDLHAALRGKGKTLLVYGEQGIGDEIMFSTMFLDVMRDYRLVFDCHPRLERLHKTSFWGTRQFSGGGACTAPVIVPNRKHRGDASERPLTVEVDAKIAAANLCRIYRRELADFQGAWMKKPMLRADERETAEYREILQNAANGRTIVGLAMRGGTLSTGTHDRRLSLEAIKELMARDEFFYVSLDYEDMTEVAKWVTEAYGPKRFFWPASINFAWDYDHVAALVRATDGVISVPQSVAHLSAALKHPTVVLNPPKVAWREANPYGKDLRWEPWYWYGTHARMLRRTTGGAWPISEALQTIRRGIFT